MTDFMFHHWNESCSCRQLWCGSDFMSNVLKLQRFPPTNPTFQQQLQDVSCFVTTRFWCSWADVLQLRAAVPAAFLSCDSPPAELQHLNTHLFEGLVWSQQQIHNNEPLWSSRMKRLNYNSMLPVIVCCVSDVFQHEDSLRTCCFTTQTLEFCSRWGCGGSRRSGAKRHAASEATVWL